MSLTIPQELKAFVQEELASGRYRSEEEIVSKGLRLLQENERKRAELRKELQIGLDDIARGDVIHIRGDEELKAFFDDIKREVDENLDATSGHAS